MRERIETVIGGGQAGLAMSYWLTQRGREHATLEQGRVAERWRSQRQDSLYFQFPRWSMQLPDHAYRGHDPDGFAQRDESVRLRDIGGRMQLAITSDGGIGGWGPCESTRCTW